MSAGVVVVLLAAGCGGGGGGPPTGVPPDRLSVRVDGAGYHGFRTDLDCGVADLDACIAVLDAVARIDLSATCTPVEDDGGRIEVSGTIEGDRVSAVLRRRTTCEIEDHDRVLAALGL
ncbi:hypothetical protein [Miltoncostaea oceani]|uniref:hypothetical protein n=1 Tax=Miltoncostaea oceani TaxID=2843216 RepID=UPI001C3C259D|nr:hypothetical protein [Miltoncostaea oceani]